MIVMTILYPRTDDSTFDMDYYVGSHMPMFAEVLGDACGGWGAIDVPAGKYAAMGWIMATSQDELNATLAEHGAKIMGDVPNYTNVQPETIVGEVTGGSQ